MILAMLLVLPAMAAERSLPRGENNPQVIEKIYELSPGGEVHFVKSVEKSAEVHLEAHSALYRKPTGALLPLAEIEGPRLCDSWLESDKNEEIPEGCSFVFQEDAGEETRLRVRSSDLTEASLFRLVRGRERHVAL